MAYQLALHPSALDAVNQLPAITRMETLLAFCRAMEYGITACGAGGLHWGLSDEFSLSLARDQNDVELSNGVMAKGFCKTDFDNTFYISRIHHIRDEQCCVSGEKSHLLKYQHVKQPDTTDGYIPLDKEWVKKELENPFLEKAFDNRKTNALLPSTIAMEVQFRFYGSVRDIYKAKEREWQYKTACCYNNELVAPYCKRVVFDATKRNQLKDNSLIDFIQSLKAFPLSKMMTFVNFIDEQDPLSLAQHEYINLVTMWLHKQYTGMSVQIVDVIIRDIQGARPYYDEFLHYYKQNGLGRDKRLQNHDPIPFTMLLGYPATPIPGRDDVQLTLPFIDQQRLCDIDLFTGCREKGLKGNIDAGSFRGNLARITHRIMRYAGFFSAKASLQIKDFRGMSEWDFWGGIAKLLDHTVIIRVQGGKDSLVMKTAISAAAHSLLTGYPYITLIQADDDPKDEDLIKVMLDGEECHYFGYTKEDLEVENEATIWRIVYAIQEAYDTNPRLARFLVAEMPG